MKMHVTLKVTFVCLLSLTLVILVNLVKTINESDSIGADLVNTPAELLVIKEYHSNIQIGPTNQEQQLTNSEATLLEKDIILSSIQGGREPHRGNPPPEYIDPSEQIYLRQGEDKYKQGFITPQNELVSAEVKNIAGDNSDDIAEFWADYQRLYDWIIKNIEYSHDSYTPALSDDLNEGINWMRDFWKMPEETLNIANGDCEDMAVLLASMMLCYNDNEYTIWAIGIRNDDIGHIAVAFPVVGGRLTILDPAGNYYTGCHNGQLTFFDIETAINEWLSYWSTKIPGATITCVFANDFSLEFSSTEEFIKWCREY